MDLKISRLPQSTQVSNLKEISGSKHIINAAVDFDNLKGTCKGTGRIQIRLNHGETADQVKLNFLRKGYIVQDVEQCHERNSVVTGTPTKRENKFITDTGAEKQSSLMTQNPEIFGTTTQRFATMDQF